MLHEVCQDEGTLEERLAVDCARVVNLGMLKGGDRKMQMNGCPEGHVSRFAHAALVVHIDTKNQEFSEKKSKVDVWLEIGMEPVSLLSSNTSTLSSVVDQPWGACRQVHTPPEAFGAQSWKDYFGVEVDAEPPLPANIEEILNSKAPFLLEDERSCRRVRDNHLLTLIPGKVGGGAFTLDKLGDLALRHFPENNKNDEGKHTHGYRYYSRCLAHQNRKVPLSEEAYWLLLPKTILADSRGKKFSAQNTMVMVYSDSGYQLPHALEVATSLLSHYVRSKECLYGNVPWTYTRCSDQDKNGNPLVVGGPSSSGLYIYDDRYDFSGIGVSCCWKL